MDKNNNVIYYNFSKILTKKNNTIRNKLSDDLNSLIIAIENLLEQPKDNIELIQQNYDHLMYELWELQQHNKHISKTVEKKVSFFNQTFEAINNRCLEKSDNFRIVFQIRNIGDITEYMGFDNGLPIYTTLYHKAVIENDIQKSHSLLVPP